MLLDLSAPGSDTHSGQFLDVNKSTCAEAWIDDAPSFRLGLDWNKDRQHKHNS